MTASSGSMMTIATAVKEIVSADCRIQTRP